MKLFTFTDLMDQTHSIQLSDVRSLKQPSNRVHDHGMVMLTNGEAYSFRSESEFRRLERELMHSPSHDDTREQCKVVITSLSSHVMIMAEILELDVSQEHRAQCKSTAKELATAALEFAKTL